MYTTRVRARTSYSNGFWRSALEDRITLGTGDDITNSSGYEVTASSWPLDPKHNFTTATTALVKASTTKAGELQNNYTHFFSGSTLMGYLGAWPMTRYSTWFRALDSVAAPLYARKHVVSMPRSFVNPAGIVLPQTSAWYAPSASSPWPCTNAFSVS